MKKIYRKAFRLFFLLCLTNAIGFISSGFMTPDTVNWYNTLNLSPLTPPDYVFPMVWSTLFILMSFSGFLCWGKTSPRPFVFFLACILLWPFTFFYLRSPLWALFVLLGYLLFGFITFKCFIKTSKTAGYLFIPTLLWGLFALYLNSYIVLN